jgi:hypothetical protein
MTTKPAAPPRANANPSPASAPVPNTSMQVQSCSSNLSPPRSLAPGSPASSSTASHQASPTAAFQPQASPSASAPAPRSLIRKVLDEPGIWIGVGLAIAAVVVAIYYGAVMLSYAKWTKHNDFREGCINDREHKLPLSTECSEELLRSRVAAMAKRQIEAAHSALLGEHGIRFAGMEFAASLKGECRDSWLVCLVIFRCSCSSLHLSSYFSAPCLDTACLFSLTWSFTV